MIAGIQIGRWWRLPVLQSPDDRLVPGNEPLDFFVSHALFRSQATLHTILFDFLEPFFLKQPFFNDVQLFEQSPIINLCFDFGQAAPLPCKDAKDSFNVFCFVEVFTH